MNQSHVQTIAAELALQDGQVEAVAALLSEDASIPFISRYRKEATGSLDEVAVAAIRDRLHQLSELDKRREAIVKSLKEHGLLTETLAAQVYAAETLAALEDIYLPYRPKRRTRATIAKEKGLEPLAWALLKQDGRDPAELAVDYLDAKRGIDAVSDALAGARDILAEHVNEDNGARADMRRLFAEKALFISRVATGKEAQGAKYRDYFDWQEPAKSAPSHRVLAMRRGEKADILNLTVAPPEDAALHLLEERFVTGQGPDAAQVRLAVHDGYKRLLSRAMETELRLTTKSAADAEAIKVFAANLRELLMTPPLGAKRVMAIDPGYRTGCKVVCLDRQGKLLHNETVYPHNSAAQQEKAANRLKSMVYDYNIEAVAIGNGTAGRETEAFVKALDLETAIPVLLVNESGASIYSASEAAREEFPEQDLTVRGAVSIGRRLMDPLSELVKIDPKSIGVGQYQHDVDQTELKAALDDVVVSCVNAVGVDVNRASAQLLTYVSGLGPRLAKNIVAHRDQHGAFDSRQQLTAVTRLGPKAFEQCAGFLRVKGGRNPLDASAVHPERYALVDRMAADLGASVKGLMQDRDLRARIDIGAYVGGGIGLPTLEDILAELAKPGLDPRDTFEAFAFREGVNSLGDLEPGMRLPGIVTNVTRFGAFVDVGVHQDGLVHISQLADRFVKDPADVVKVQQKVTVTVLEVDTARSRISLSMKGKLDGIPTDRDAGRPTRRGSAEPKGSRRSRSSRTGNAPKRQTPAPFNNPFADLLKGG
ncbi:MAG: Tex family protein [Desulfosarcinaceae bacterium]|nr:Tex family protein [Desulfosarcinaceae bacterium]